MARIFEENGFKVRRNFKFRGREMHEIDVFAEKGDDIFLVECKKWRRSISRKVILKMKKRKEDFITNKRVHLLIVTLLPEARKEGEVFIVPVFALNSFLLEFHTL